MVRRLFVSGLCSYTTEETFRKHFEQFGELYECFLPMPSSFTVYDHGKDEENPDVRSSIKVDYAKNDEKDEEFDVLPYNTEVHGTFEKYMELVKDGEVFVKKRKKTSKGFGFITFVDRQGFDNCTKTESHIIDGLNCSVEPFKEEELIPKIKSKRIFVSYFPLKTLTAGEIKTTFGPFGKITDVEFVKDTDGPLYFCLITFTTTEAVDECLKSAHYVNDVKLFVRRGITREAMKIAEQNEKERNAGAKHTKKSSGFTSNLQKYFPIAAARSLVPGGYGSRGTVNNVNPELAFKKDSDYGYAERPW